MRYWLSNYKMKIFSVQKKERTNFKIILWWELRRIIYNIFLFISVFISLKILNIELSTLEMGSGEYFVFLIFIGFIIVCNLIYTLGWLIELCIKRSVTYAPKFLKITLFITSFCLVIFVAGLYVILH